MIISRTVLATAALAVALPTAALAATSAFTSAPSGTQRAMLELETEHGPLSHVVLGDGADATVHRAGMHFTAIVTRHGSRIATLTDDHPVADSQGARYTLDPADSRIAVSRG